jgi:hypothetical protein
MYAAEASCIAFATKYVHILPRSGASAGLRSGKMFSKKDFLDTLSIFE